MEFDNWWAAEKERLGKSGVRPETIDRLKPIYILRWYEMIPTIVNHKISTWLQKVSQVGSANMRQSNEGLNEIQRNEGDSEK